MKTMTETTIVLKTKNNTEFVYKPGYIQRVPTEQDKKLPEEVKRILFQLVEQPLFVNMEDAASIRYYENTDLFTTYKLIPTNAALAAKSTRDGMLVIYGSEHENGRKREILGQYAYTHTPSLELSPVLCYRMEPSNKHIPLHIDVFRQITEMRLSE